EHHRRRGFTFGRSRKELSVDVIARQLELHLCRRASARRKRTAERSAPFEQVLDFFTVLAGMEERSLFQLLVRDRQLELVAELPQLVEIELLLLMRDVAAGDPFAERPTLDRVTKDDRWAALVLHRALVSGVELAEAVSAAAQLAKLFVREIGDQL